MQLYTALPSLLMSLVNLVVVFHADPVNNILDSQIAFVSLTLFNAMKGPLFLLPFGIVSLIQGSVALGRISLYLDDEELDSKAVRNFFLSRNC